MLKIDADLCDECNYIYAGTEAEHRFWQLRQRFGRERKKVIQFQGRSGAGATHQTYTPQWNLYNELMFLVDVIKHRKQVSIFFSLYSIIFIYKFIYFHFVLFRTTSNYKRKFIAENLQHETLSQGNVLSTLSQVNIPSTFTSSSPLTSSWSEGVPPISCKCYFLNF